MKPSRVGLIINRAPKAELNPGILEEIRNQGLDLIGVVPQDETVYEYDCDGKPTVTLPEDNPMRKAAFEIFDKLGLYLNINLFLKKRITHGWGWVPARGLL